MPACVGYAFEKVINNNLCLQVFDHDRFSRDDIIGEVILPMTPQDLVNGLTLWKDLQPSQRHMVRCTTTATVLRNFSGTTRVSRCQKKAYSGLAIGRITIRGRHADNPGGRHSIRTNQQSTSINPPIFTLDALPATTLPIIMAWNRHRNMLDYIRVPWLGSYGTLQWWANPKYTASQKTAPCLWQPHEIGQAVIFLPCGFCLLCSIFYLFSWSNLIFRRLDVYHTSTHGVTLVQI